MANDKVEKLYNNLVGKMGGLDLSKEPGVSKDALEEVFLELKEEYKRKAKDKAREVVAKVIELRKKMSAARKEFDKQEKKFEEEIVRMLKEVSNALGGQQPEVEQPLEVQGEVPAAPVADAPVEAAKPQE